MTPAVAVNLRHDMTPEHAETRIWAALIHHPGRPITVNLNGFPLHSWGRVASRLPGHVRVARVSDNVIALDAVAPTGAGGFTASVISGRFDRPDAKVAADWQHERDAGASLLFGTELAGRNVATLLARDTRYGLIHTPGRGVGENALEYAKADWEVIRSTTVQVTPGGGPGRFSVPSAALVTILRNRHSRRLLINVQNHDPARPTESGVNMRRWLQVKRAEARVIHKLEKDYPGAAVAVTGDSNARQQAPWFLRAMARLLPGFHQGGGIEFGAAWVKGLERVGHPATIRAQGSDHPIRRLGFRWPA